ncbi:hypothetical protein ACFWAY_39130 [Rhodococcus sp. NPDC059968]|uniref:hypothetical protein n=1 Tax=Rhodococcus sp. NPDC059968 TaxID=3347017 RepID=UPI00366C6DB1
MAGHADQLEEIDKAAARNHGEDVQLPLADRHDAIGCRLSRTGIAVPVLGALLISLLVGTSVLTISLRAGQAEAERNELIIRTAHEVVGNLVTLNHESAQSDMDRITSSSTGTFRDQFTDAGGTFASVLSDGQVDSIGEVKEAGLVSADDSGAVVLAAVSSNVKNSAAPQGEERVYRMKVSLSKIDGAWLVSDVEFVS